MKKTMKILCVMIGICAIIITSYFYIAPQFNADNNDNTISIPSMHYELKENQ